MNVDPERELLTEAGIPSWAPYSPQAVDHPCFYSWVHDDGSLRGALVGTADVDALGRLTDPCRRVLMGREQRRPGSAPIDLDGLVALIHVQPEGVGRGPLGRAALRPLRDLLEFAVVELMKRREI